MEMKKIVRMFFVFAAAALVMAFAGCGGDDNPEGGGKPTNIAVKDAAGTAVNSLALKVNETKKLTVSADGATDLYWDIKSGSATDVVTLTGDDKAEVSIKGAKAGSTKLVAYAENAKGSISKEITITVTEAEDPNGPDGPDTTDPNLIFEWDYEKNDGVTFTGTWNAANTGIILKGKGKLTSIPIRIASGNASALPAPNSGSTGIYHDGTVASMMALLIGTNDSTQSTCDTWGSGVPNEDTGSAPEGVFKFTEYLGDSGKTIKISIGIEFLSDATGTANRSFGVYLNNSHTAGSYSPLNVTTGNAGTSPNTLQASGNAARIGYWLKPDAVAGSTNPTPGAYNKTTKIFTCSFDKDGFTGSAVGSKFNTSTNNYATLNKAFFQIQNMGNGTSSDGAKINIKSIKIELVD
jgi:hypothetical protein